MENSQSVQYELTQLIGDTPELTNSESRLLKNSNVLIYLVAHHPWLLLTGLLAMFLGGGAFAIYSLGHVGRLAQEEPEQIPAVVEKPLKTPSENSNSTPLWIVVAIALSCGSGCLIIFRILNRPKQPQKVQKHINRYEAHLAQSHYPRLEPRLPRNPPVFVPQQQLTPVMPIAPKTKHLVTVLPPEHKHRLDTRTESLADLMDLRKESSLSAILHKY
ncbi:hypothetical protein [aff. Roholtiella sp. LEGE 12411]|uniref:hypothetical protein n=1 Tax=aff. Roholtiella sp. LEGE 12411 TaxID=1828822 RepID=UPI00188298DB|nr:hypothetical protein [aff. Roholtiella sp. LEGE 12411]MBE9035956.1 hypothetical protein [aff. Roholtiella sp. LEGE 12411]